MGRRVNDSDERISKFVDRLVKHAQRKRELYDGFSEAAISELPDSWLRYCTEELGETAAAITRNRPELAKAECIDLAHCAMLLYFVIEQTYES